MKPEDIGTVVSRAVVVLSVPYLPESVEQRWYLEPCGGSSLLKRAVIWCARQLGGLPIVLAYNDATELPALASTCEETGAIPIRTSSSSRIDVLVSLSLEGTDIGQGLFVSIPHMFLPPGLVRRLVDGHLSDNRDLTAYKHGGGYPLAMSKRLARLLGAIRPPSLGPNVSGDEFYHNLLNSPHLEELAKVEAGFTLSKRLLELDAESDAGRQLLIGNDFLTRPFYLVVLGSVLQGCPEAGDYSALRERIQQAYAERARDDSSRRLRSARWALRGRARATPRSGPKPILFASAYGAFSGAEESLCLLVANLDLARYRPAALVALEGQLTRRLREAGAAVVVPPRELGPTPSSIAFLTDHLASNRVHLVHINGLWPALTTAAKLLGLPVVNHLRVFPTHDYAAALSESDEIICVSEAVREKALQYPLDPQKIRCIPNGVDTDYFRPDPAERDRGREQYALSGLVVAMVAYIGFRKRQDIVLAAARQVVQRLPEALFVFVGDVVEREYNHYLQGLIRDHRLQEHVRFVGFVRDIRRIEAASDISILCSDQEPLARALLESSAMELGIVARNTGGTPDVIRDDESGILISGEEPELYAEAIIRLATDCKLRERLGLNARRRVEAHFSLYAHVGAVMKEYDALLSGRCRQAPSPAARAA